MVMMYIIYSLSLFSYVRQRYLILSLAYLYLSFLHQILKCPYFPPCRLLDDVCDYVCTMLQSNLVHPFDVIHNQVSDAGISSE